MDRHEIINLLEQHMSELSRFGVKKIGIFGSAVRNEMKNSSDIDFIVEFEENRGGFKDFGKLVDFLENLFGRKVDILTPAGLNTIRIKSVRKEIKREIIYVQEKQ